MLDSPKAQILIQHPHFKKALRNELHSPPSPKRETASAGPGLPPDPSSLFDNLLLAHEMRPGVTVKVTVPFFSYERTLTECLCRHSKE
jgi:hypothetical protein